MESLLLVAALALWALRLLALPTAARVLSEVSKGGAAPSPEEEYVPPVTVVIPSRGGDERLAVALAAVLEQDYPCFDVVVAVPGAEDPGCAVVERLRPRLARSRARSLHLVFGGISERRAQKLDNQIAALRAAAPDSEAFVFVDADGAPPTDLLRSLVAPLHDDAVGATTGCPWLVERRSVWDGVAALYYVGMLATGAWGRGAWGGAMAIRRSSFDDANVAEAWDRAGTDDLVLANAVLRTGRRIALAPRALVPVWGGHDARSLWEWILRQLTLGRRYAPGLWLSSGLSFVLPALGAFTGAALLASGETGAGAWLLGALLPAGVLDGFAGIASIRSAFLKGGADPAAAGGLPPRFGLVLPLVTACLLPAYLLTAFSRRMAWGDAVIGFERGGDVRVLPRAGGGSTLPAGAAR